MSTIHRAGKQIRVERRVLRESGGNCEKLSKNQRVEYRNTPKNAIEGLSLKPLADDFSRVLRGRTDFPRMLWPETI